ncbi:hypothetical protein [Streptomyces sp. NPDC048196]|uniref:hypothetical protein n=1 Tax=Streptomyces sp. NPDC048196 TaxID=3154712 RepID=UPI003409D54D
MTLVFREIRFDVDISPSRNRVELRRDVNLPGRLRTDDNGNRVIDVALKSFKLEAYINGNVEDYEFGGEEVDLQVQPTGHQSGEVVLTVNLRPREQIIQDPAWQFKGKVKALVIADLVEDHQ